MPPADGRTRSRGRTVLVLVLVVLACFATVFAVIGTWARRNVLDTDRFVSRAAPTIEDPAVQQAVSGFVTDEIITIIDPVVLLQDAFEDLPAAQPLVVPLSSAIEQFVGGTVDQVVASDGFAQLWEAVIETAHSAAVRLLDDDSQVVLTEDGVVTIDLVPVVRAVLVRIAELSPDVLGVASAVQEQLEEGEPGEARARIEEVLGVELDDDFGQIVLEGRGEKLDALQQGVHTFERFVWLAVLLAVAATIAALVLSRSRRRTGIQLAVGIAIGLVLLRRVTFLAQDNITEAAGTAPSIAAVGTVVDRFLEPLQTFAAIALGVLIAIAAVLYVTGPSRRAERIRSSASVGWVRAHREWVAWAVLGGAALVLWFADLGWIGVFTALGVIVAAVVTLRSPPPEAPTSVDEAAAVPGP